MNWFSNWFSGITKEKLLAEVTWLRRKLEEEKIKNAELVVLCEKLKAELAYPQRQYHP